MVGVGFDPGTLDLPGQVDLVQVPRVRGLALPELTSRLARSDVAIFHGMSAVVASAMVDAPSRVLKVWSGWGGDYYGSTLDHSRGQLAPLTRAAWPGTTLTNAPPRVLLNSVRSAQLLHAAARSADVFSAPVPQDELVFRKRFRGFTGRYHQLNYLTAESGIAPGPDGSDGHDILLGNSASATNNHLDALEVLARSDLGESRVVVPLSYGDPTYAAMVAERGHELLGEKFVSLREHLPLHDYHEVLSRCSVVVMAHWRQQGVGNVLRAVWQGAHVVLDPRNPVADYLASLGLPAHMLADADLAALVHQRLDPETVRTHRAILVERWGRRAVVRNVRELLGLEVS